MVANVAYEPDVEHRAALAQAGTPAKNIGELGSRVYSYSFTGLKLGDIYSHSYSISIENSLCEGDRSSSTVLETPFDQAPTAEFLGTGAEAYNDAKFNLRWIIPAASSYGHNDHDNYTIMINEHANAQIQVNGDGKPETANGLPVYEKQEVTSTRYLT